MQNLLREDKKVGYVYTLACPDTELVRYVGQTINLQKRFNLHLFHSKNGRARTYKEKWINTLTTSGKKPIIEIIWQGDASILDQKETEFIALFKSFGAHLTNATLGGTTTRGRKCSEETKAKLSKIMTGRKCPNYTLTPEGLASLREKRKDFKMSEEAKRKISEARKGQPSHWTYQLMPENQKARLAALGRLGAKKVIAIKDGIQTTYDSLIEAERQTGCDRKTMRNVATGVYKQCKGFIFKFSTQ